MDNGSRGNLGPIWGAHEKHRCIVSEISYHIELHMKIFHKFREHVSLLFLDKTCIVARLECSIQLSEKVLPIEI